MRVVFVDADVRSRALRWSAIGLAAAAALGTLGILAPAGVPKVVAAVAVAGALLAGAAGACLSVQQGLLERPRALAPLPVARWGGTLLASVAGPLLMAKLVLAAIFGVGLLMTEGATGAMAGVGLAWLVLPMALLVTGTAALKLPALAADRPLDTAGVIRLADGREWSLVPLGIALTVAVLLLVAGGAALMTVGLLGLIPAAAGFALLLPVVAALTRRWQALQPI
jgi:hypothetical protein